MNLYIIFNSNESKIFLFDIIEYIFIHYHFINDLINIKILSRIYCHQENDRRTWIDSC